MPGFRAAMKYAYSSTRVKAMESKLISRETLNRMLAAKDAGSIAAMLLQSDYKSDIEKVGGTGAMAPLVDFALSKSLGRETGKLITIAPKDQKGIISMIAGAWDIGNIKLAIETVGSGKDFDSISRYLIESKYAGMSAIKEAMGAKSVDGFLEKLMLRTPYSKQLRSALDAYRKTHSATDAGSALEKAYYIQLGSVIGQLKRIDKDAYDLIRKRIDLRNALTLMRAKRQGAEFPRIAGFLLPNGSLGPQRLEKMFKDSRSVESIAENLRIFNLKQAIAAYEESQSKPLLIFEIAMLNEIFKSALRGVRHSVLSFGSLIAFLYLKEIEVFTLRILIKGKSYGLGDQEIKSMISWSK